MLTNIYIMTIPLWQAKDKYMLVCDYKFEGRMRVFKTAAGGLPDQS